jgi:hypothetical protein
MLTIFLSGSRRGIITFGVILILLLLIQFIFLMNWSAKVKKLANSSIAFFGFIIVFFISIWLFSFKASYDFKRKTLELVGSKNFVSTKIQFALVLYKYSKIFNKDQTFSEIYENIWYKDFDKMLDPDSGWGTRVHKTVFPLTGKNVEIVPFGARGYLMDSTCNASSWNGNAYSYTLIGNKKVKKGDIVQASVYCYLSEDFNGSWVQISSEGSTYGNIVDQYNIQDSITDREKGSYSKYINFYHKGDTIKISSKSTYSFDKTITGKTENLISNGDFTSGLKYWYSNADSTNHSIIETPYGKGIRISRTNGTEGYFSLIYGGRPIIFHASHKYQINFKYKVQKGVAVPFRIGWWVNDGKKGYSSSALPLSINDLDNGWKEVKCSYRFIETQYNLIFFLNSLEDYSIVDIADVEISDLDKETYLPSYEDQIEELKLRNKGTWQKLTLRAECNEGYAPVYLYFSKNFVSDFSSLNGFVIFAYPKYEIISKKDSTSSFYSDPGSDSIGVGALLFDKNNLSDDSTLNLSWNSTKHGVNRNGIIEFCKKPTASSFLYPSILKTYQADVISSLISILNTPIPKKMQEDPIRKFSAKLFSKDTVYYAYNNELVIDTSVNQLFGTRIIRWRFFGQIFLKEYNLRQKVFGGGFKFLSWYGYRFLKDKSLSDYPHNPFLSILLYSGIFGLLVYIIFIFKSISYYIKYLKEYPIIVIFFIITFLFSFFSSGSPFDPPTLGFFSILPFFINYIYKMKDSNEETNNINQH